MTPGNGMRLDAWPPGGGPPASDLAFLREQLLDPLGIEYGLLQPLRGRPIVLNVELERGHVQSPSTIGSSRNGVGRSRA